jgi:hypothetical protein
MSLQKLKAILKAGRYESVGCVNYPYLPSPDKKQNSTGRKEIIHTDDSIIAVYSGNIHTATNQQTVVRYHKDGTVTSSSTRGSFYKGTYTTDETNNTANFAVKGVNEVSNKREYLEGNISNVDGAIEVACNAFNNKSRYQYFSSTEVMTPSPRNFNCVVNQNAQIINVDGNRVVLSFSRNAIAKITELCTPGSDNTDLVKLDVPIKDAFNVDEIFEAVSGRISISGAELSVSGYFDLQEVPTVKSNSIEAALNVRDVTPGVDWVGQTVLVELNFQLSSVLANKITKSLAYRHTIYYPNRPPVAGVSEVDYSNTQTYTNFAKALIDMNAYRLN